MFSLDLLKDAHEAYADDSGANAHVKLRRVHEATRNVLKILISVMEAYQIDTRTKSDHIDSLSRDSIRFDDEIDELKEKAADAEEALDDLKALADPMKVDEVNKRVSKVQGDMADATERGKNTIKVFTKQIAELTVKLDNWAPVAAKQAEQIADIERRLAIHEGAIANLTERVDANMQAIDGLDSLAGKIDALPSVLDSTDREDNG